MDSSAEKRVGVNPRVGTPGAGAVNLENDFNVRNSIVCRLICDK